MAKRQPLPRPLAVKEVLKGLMKPLDWDNLGQRSLIRQVWERVVPPRLLPHTRLLEIRRRRFPAGPFRPVGSQTGSDPGDDQSLCNPGNGRAEREALFHDRGGL